MNIRRVSLSAKQGLLLTVLVTSVLLFVHYRALLLNLDATLCIEPYRDGIKTYMNASFHARYDSTYTFFEGMNYPYKEHIMAATELPGLAILEKALKPVFPEIHRFTFGITHAFLIFCILLCAVFLYLIFTGLKIPAWFAIPAAIGLTFLAPQNMRFGPHLGLAPPFVVPAVIFGLLMFEKASDSLKKWWASFFIALTVLIASLLHFYFFAISVLTISLYFFFSLIQKFTWKRVGQTLPYYAVMVILPLAFFFFWMIANDPVNDRSPKPWGFFYYHSQLESIFASLHFPLYQWIDEHLINIEKTDFEGWAYIGMVADVFVLVVLFRWIRRFFKRPLFDFLPEGDRRFCNALLWTGVVIMVLSCSEPFATRGFEFLLDYTGPLRQFRSTGRFAWVFYFVINVLAFADFYHLISKWKRKWARIAGFTFVFAALFYEANYFIHSKFMYSGNNLQQVTELLPGKRFTDVPGIDYSKYQAILPIPYYSVGSNNFGSTGGALTVQKSLILSEQTGLPVTGAMLTRSSRQQTFYQMQLVSEPYRMPKIFEDYPNTKPLLLLNTGFANQDDTLRYGHLLDDVTMLFKANEWSLYEMELASFQRRIDRRKEEVRKALQSAELHNTEGFLSTDSLENFVYESFEGRTAANSYFGNGGFDGTISDLNTVYSGNLPNATPGRPYHLLAWVYVDEDRFTSTVVRIQESDEQGNKLQEKVFMVGPQVQVYDPEGWVLVECPFSVVSGQSRLTVTFQMEDGGDQRLWMDELLIKPADVDLYRSGAGIIWWNNRFWKLSDSEE